LHQTEDNYPDNLKLEKPGLLSLPSYKEHNVSDEKNYSRMKMKPSSMAIIAGLGALLLPNAAIAQTYNTQRFGSQTFTRGQNGYSANQQSFGDLTFGRDNQGNRWTTQRFGDQSVTRVTPGFNQKR
jgi:hypothetical protein